MSREKQIEEMTGFFMSLDTYDHEECENCGKWEHNCCDDGCFANKVAIDFYNAGYRKQEWIRVDERLPEEDVRVLVYINSERSYTKIDTDRMVDGEWVRWSKDITHWMPLPEAPKMKGGAE